MRKYIVSAFFIYLYTSTQAQHLPVYSLYMFNGLVLNPAYAGSNDVLTAMIHYRDQWVGFEGHPTTYTLAMDTPLKNKKFNLGAIFSFDQYGVTNRTDYMQSFAYRQQISSTSSLSAGFQAGITYQHINYAELNLQDDNAFSYSPKNVIFPKIGLGIHYTSKKFYAGISMPQLTLYNRKDTTAGMAYYTSQIFYFTAGYSIKANNSLEVKPSLLLKYIQHSPMQLDINTTVTYKKFITGGLSYRTGNAMIFLMEFKVDQFKFGYAYDYYLNSLKSNSKGSHEIMIKYEFRYIVNVKDPRNFY
jgi:type IX secretion system PorP/SprF family membrane protein